MKDRRSDSRGRSPQGGRILFHQGRSAIDCTIRNFSEGGACVEVAGTVGIPASFELQLEGEIITRQCTQRWTAGDRIGVSFDAASSPAAPPDIRSRNGSVPVASIPKTSGELLQLRTALEYLHAALDHVKEGVIVLDSELHVRYMNRSVRTLWQLGDQDAARRPHYSELIRIGRRIGLLPPPPEGEEAYIARSIALVSIDDPNPVDFQLRDRTIRGRCAPLPGGGHILTFDDISGLIHRAHQPQTLATTDEPTGKLAAG